MLGLVLSGGNSQRMGCDKGSISYHGIDQRTYCYELLKPFCQDVYISCRKEQIPILRESQNRITDDPWISNQASGPCIGLLSAHYFSPSSAWLVLACDMPFIGADLIQSLVAKRKPWHCATAFLSPEDGRPEPLCAIWEPRALELLEERVLHGRFSAREALENLDCEFTEPQLGSRLVSINNPQEIRKHFPTITEWHQEEYGFL
ncbi:MAG: NTP transferase domain-containing protein [Bdellovibrionota bacterium]